MSADRSLSYLDASAIVKLVVADPGSQALRRYLVRRQPLVSSVLARTEVARALMPSGPEAVARGEDALRRVQLRRVNDWVLAEARRMEPAELRSPDAIHLSSARKFGSSVRRVVTCDERMAAAAAALGWSVASPA
jgi:predicted nucleic acid-binding protein